MSSKVKSPGLDNSKVYFGTMREYDDDDDIVCNEDFSSDEDDAEPTPARASYRAVSLAAAPPLGATGRARATEENPPGGARCRTPRPKTTSTSWRKPSGKTQLKPG